ncbi:hemiasterlin resistant protein 1-like [Anopheles marshallii]|uniref:hemiasterlin resistant protein 1-like n=1 Tax=Anopheles marshallii TaxID=1521116 RepID=UPI00237B2C23|nr:hemiasterlin resistant protein 1-like [Anopheles marshallii]
MPRRDTRSKTVPPSRKFTTTDTKSQHGTGQSVPAKAEAEPTKSPSASTAPGSGLFSQMAATAGGVAIGSVLGRALGGLFERSEPKDASTNAVEKDQKSAMESITPDRSASVEQCSMEIKQFLSCVDKEMDVKICEGFKEALQQCKTKAASSISMFDHV